MPITKKSIQKTIEGILLDQDPIALKEQWFESTKRGWGTPQYLSVELMAYALQNFNTINRDISVAKVKKYIQEIADGDFPALIEGKYLTVTREDYPRILSAQHRMLACVLAKIDFQIIGFWREDPLNWLTYSIESRKPADVVKMGLKSVYGTSNTFFTKAAPVQGSFNLAREFLEIGGFRNNSPDKTSDYFKDIIIHKDKLDFLSKDDKYLKLKGAECKIVTTLVLTFGLSYISLYGKFWEGDMWDRIKVAISVCENRNAGALIVVADSLIRNLSLPERINHLGSNSVYKIAA